MIETRVPMIDVFNCLVESQKIPIFSVAGEPYNELLARIAMQAEVDLIMIGNHGHSEFRKLVIGSVADRVSRSKGPFDEGDLTRGLDQ